MLTGKNKHMIEFRPSRKTLGLFGLAVFMSAGLTLPHEGRADKRPEAEELKNIESELQELRLRKQRLDQEALALQREEEALQKKLVDAAASVQDAETRLSDIEKQVIGLLVQQNVIVKSLLDQEAALSDLLAALESLEINRPPALAIEPDDAVKAARTAMLLAALIPELQKEAQKLNDDLERLASIRVDIERQKQAEEKATLALDTERASLETLLAELADKRKSKANEAEAERKQIASLAAEARDLRSLLDQLSRRGIASVPRIKPEINPETPSTSRPENVARAKVSLPPLREAHANATIRRFANAKGALKQPVSGFLQESFGQKVDSGAQSRGIRYATRAKAQVIAPFDGTIVFAGPFLGYGQLLIIEAGDGYHILLSGMDRIDGVVGQRLLAGEPVGVMGSGGVDGSENDALSLYVEFRKDGKPFNPVPWMAAREGKAKG